MGSCQHHQRRKHAHILNAPPLIRHWLIEKLAHFLSPFLILGAKYKIVEGHTETWRIAKMWRLVGALEPPVDDTDDQEEFLVAEDLEPLTTFEHPDARFGNTIDHCRQLASET